MDLIFHHNAQILSLDNCKCSLHHRGPTSRHFWLQRGTDFPINRDQSNTRFLILSKISFQYINFPWAKMGSKTLLLFFISLAMVLAITSQVAARELAETSTSVDNCKTFILLSTYSNVLNLFFFAPNFSYVTY